MVKFYCSNVQHIADPLLNTHYSVCPKACKTLKTTVSKRLSSGSKENNDFLRTLILNFGPIVSLQKSIPTMTMLNVINDIGSSMGLWLGFSTYSIFKMLLLASYAWTNKKVAANNHQYHPYNHHHCDHPYNQHHYDHLYMCVDTKNLNETESKTFFPIPNISNTESDTFSIPNIFRYRIRYFF